MSSNDTNKRPVLGPNLPSDQSTDSDFEEESVPIVCKECKKQFTLKGNLKKHFLKSHPEKDFEPVKELKFPCEDCSCQYKTKKGLYQHQRLKHSQKEKIKELHQCFMCPLKLEKNNLINHYENEHNIDTREEILSFSTYEDVIRWKENLEKENNVKFIAVTGTKKKNSDVKYHYFNCHRSGKYYSKSAGIRHIKIQGSKKCNFLCPSRITVTEAADGSCNVKYVKTHIGHDMEHLKLSTTKRLAKKIAMKIPLDQSGDLKICESAEAEFLLKQLKNPSTSEPIEKEKSRLTMEWGNIISSSSKKQLEYIKKNLSHVKAVLPTIDDETSTTQFTSKNESAKKTLDPQRRFLSKKRKLNNSVSMMAEDRIAANHLLQAAVDQLNESEQ